MTANQIAQNISKQLEEFLGSKREAELTTWTLLEHVTNKSKENLLLKKEFSLSTSEFKKIEECMRDIVKKNKPLAYIVGWVPFLGLKIYVEPPVLIPRYETEEWCQKLISELKEKNIEKIKILDLCTGSGCVALALAKALPKSKIYGIDISEKAIALAKKNEAVNNTKNVKFIKSNLFQEIPGNLKFDLIISNPPYVTKEEYKELPRRIKDWEDPRALLAGTRGLEIISQIVDKSTSHMRKLNKMYPQLKAQLWVEIGSKQANTVKKLFEKNKFKNVTVLEDISGRNRVIKGEL